MSVLAKVLDTTERGQTFLADDALMRAEGRLLQEFERALTEEAIRRRLDVMVERDHMRRGYTITWAPTQGEPGVIEP